MDNRGQGERIGSWGLGTDVIGASRIQNGSSTWRFMGSYK